MIPFNKAPVTGDENIFIADAIARHEIGGDSTYSKKCMNWMEEKLGAQKVLLTTSGTTALDMAVFLCQLKPGEEVILPSYTFSSTATSILMSGGKPVFVDIRPDTMNIDERKIEAAITQKTRAIMVMHYAGVSCEMDVIMDIARRHDLFVIEDAAQAFMASYKGRFLGTIGDFGCFSFHETKNLSMGEGGAIVLRDSRFNERAEILREKGTNRSKFYRGQIDKYTWVDKGDSYLPSDILSAYLWGQLQNFDSISTNRIATWKDYHSRLRFLEERGRIKLQFIPEYCQHNAHMFYLKCKDLQDRMRFIDYMKKKEINCAFHYIPLHSAPAGKKYGRFAGEDIYTTMESEKLVRLPLYYKLTEDERIRIIEGVLDYFS